MGINIHIILNLAFQNFSIRIKKEKTSIPYTIMLKKLLPVRDFEVKFISRNHYFDVVSNRQVLSIFNKFANERAENTWVSQLGVECSNVLTLRLKGPMPMKEIVLFRPQVRQSNFFSTYEWSGYFTWLPWFAHLPERLR